MATSSTNKSRLLFTLSGIFLAGSSALIAGLIPGLPDIVWDPIQEGHMMSALAHDVENISVISRQLQMMETNAVSLPYSVRSRFQGFYQPFTRPSSMGNIFGETAIWAQAASGSLNTIEAAQGAWTHATPPIVASPLLASNQYRAAEVKSRLAGVEISDAAAVNAIQTVNGLRANSEVNGNAIRAYQSDCLAANNLTTAAQQNCASAGALLGVQSAQSTNALLASQIDLLLANVKRQRDDQAIRLNYESQVLNYRASESEVAPLSSAAIGSIRVHFHD